MNLSKYNKVITYYVSTNRISVYDRNSSIPNTLTYNTRGRLVEKDNYAENIISNDIDGMMTDDWFKVVIEEKDGNLITSNYDAEDSPSFIKKKNEILYRVLQKIGV